MRQCSCTVGKNGIELLPEKKTTHREGGGLKNTYLFGYDIF